MRAKRTLQWFRKIAIAEGISFLVLLGIAMPLKYFADMPLAVKIVGYLHGFLFIGFVILAWEVKNTTNRSLLWFAAAFVSSLIPFGTFLLDKQLRKEESQMANQQ